MNYALLTTHSSQILWGSSEVVSLNNLLKRLGWWDSTLCQVQNRQS